MNNNKLENTSNYLYTFDQILYNMSNKMLTPKKTKNITKNFIECMIPHHEAAILMCKNLLQYTTNNYLQNIAHNIINTQTNGIKQMQEIYNTTTYTNPCPNFSEYYQTYLTITKKMIYSMQTSIRSININLDFISEMIPHHEGAIAMCKNLLKYNIDYRLRMVANFIITTQSEGVKQLKELQRTLSNTK